MQIKDLCKSLFIEYTNFLLEHPNAMFYHSIKYKDFLEKILGCSSKYLLVCDNKNKILGVLPLMIKNGRYGKVINSLPFYGSNGSILTKDFIHEKILLEEYDSLIKNIDFLSSTIISNPLDKKVYKFKYNYQDERIGQWTNINEIDKDTLMDRVDSSAKRNIKKAIKNEIKINIDNSAIDFLKKVHNDNMSIIGGVPKDNIFFESLPNHFIAGLDYNIYVASKNKKPIAALLLFYFKDIVEYFMPVINQDFKSLQPLALIIYNAMLDASKNNAKWWNWGGTWLNQEGVYKFKNKWDAVDKRYFYYTICKKDKLKYLKKKEILKNYNNFYTFPFRELING